MAFTLVSWAFKEEATSTKLQAMVNNITAHDHRADGTQGAPLIGDYVDCTAALVPAAGWALTGTQRYCLLLGGRLAVVNFTVVRTGGTITGGTTGSGRPGNFNDANILTGIPAAILPTVVQHIVTDDGAPVMTAITPAGALLLESGVPSGVILTDDQLRIGGLLWRG